MPSVESKCQNCLLSSLRKVDTNVYFKSSVKGTFISDFFDKVEAAVVAFVDVELAAIAFAGLEAVAVAFVDAELESASSSSMFPILRSIFLKETFVLSWKKGSSSKIGKKQYFIAYQLQLQ